MKFGAGGDRSFLANGWGDLGAVRATGLAGMNSLAAGGIRLHRVCRLYEFCCRELRRTWNQKDRNAKARPPNIAVIIRPTTSDVKP